MTSREGSCIHCSKCALIPVLPFPLKFQNTRGYVCAILGHRIGGMCGVALIRSRKFRAPLPLPLRPWQGYHSAPAIAFAPHTLPTSTCPAWHCLPRPISSLSSLSFLTGTIQTGTPELASGGGLPFRLHTSPAFPCAVWFLQKPLVLKSVERPVSAHAVERDRRLHPSLRFFLS